MRRVRFFSTQTAGVNIQKHEPTTRSPKYQENLKWMNQEMSKIKPNPGYEKLNASEFQSAMQDAEKQEANSYYYR